MQKDGRGQGKGKREGGNKSWRREGKTSKPERDVEEPMGKLERHVHGNMGKVGKLKRHRRGRQGIYKHISRKKNSWRPVYNVSIC